MNVLEINVVINKMMCNLKSINRKIEVNSLKKGLIIDKSDKK